MQTRVHQKRRYEAAALPLRYDCLLLIGIIYQTVLTCLVLSRLPNDDHTHYWCQIYKAPQLEHKHHMIGVS